MLENFKNESLKEVLLFLVKLSLLSSLLYFISWRVDLTFLQDFTASRVVTFFKIFEFPISREGTEIFLGKTIFRITKDCTGWKGLLFFFALVISVKGGILKKVKGLVTNLPVIYSVNLLRIIVIVFLTSRYGYSAYGLLHDVLWQLSMIVTVFILWFMWLTWAKFNNKRF